MVWVEVVLLHEQRTHAGGADPSGKCATAYRNGTQMTFFGREGPCAPQLGKFDALDSLYILAAH